MFEEPPKGIKRILRLIIRLRRGLMLLGALLLGMAMGVLVLAFFLAGDIYDYQDTFDGVHLPRVDVIVCLAGGRGRIATAGDVWYRYWELSQQLVNGTGRNPAAPKPPMLYISGMGHQSGWQAFSRQLRRGVLESIRPENVILETESENTEANALLLARYAKEHGWEKILLVTSPYHMRRSRLIFEHTLRNTGRPVNIETLSVFQEPYESGEWRGGFQGIRVTLLEYLKWVYYRYTWGK